MDIERGIEAEELEIAGVDVTCLVWDQDEVEIAVRNLVLFPQFNEHFKDAFDLINTAWPRNFYTLDFAPGLKYFR